MKALIALAAALLLPVLPLAAEDVMKVGIVTSLTGPAADFGVSIRNSFQMAIDDHPERFKGIRFIYEDAGFETAKAVQAFHKLVNVDKVNLVFTWNLAFCQAIAPVAETEKVPLVAECLDQGATRGRPYVIRFFNYADEVMALQARWLKQHGQRRIALLVSDAAYLQSMSLAFKRVLDPSQEIVFEEHILPSEMDLRTVLQKVSRSRADIIGVFVSTGQIGTFYRQADALRITIPTFGTNWYESLHEIQQAGELIDGASFVSIAAKPSFVERYTKAWSNASAMAFAAPAYEFTTLLGELFGELKSAPSADRILGTFASAGFRRGTALESFRYRDTKENGKDFQLPIAVKTISKGRIVELERVDPKL